jgi:hypothetical protein
MWCIDASNPFNLCGVPWYCVLAAARLWVCKGLTRLGRRYPSLVAAVTDGTMGDDDADVRKADLEDRTERRHQSIHGLAAIRPGVLCRRVARLTIPEPTGSLCREAGRG